MTETYKISFSFCSSSSTATLNAFSPAKPTRNVSRTPFHFTRYKSTLLPDPHYPKLPGPARVPTLSSSMLLTIQLHIQERIGH